jgi:hypothetical protein
MKSRKVLLRVSGALLPLVFGCVGVVTDPTCTRPSSASAPGARFGVGQSRPESRTMSAGAEEDKAGKTANRDS